MESSSFELSSLSSTNFSDISTGGSAMAMAMKLGKMKGMKGLSGISKKGIAGGIMSYLLCTPVKIYLCIALILTIFYIIHGMIKGNLPGISTICCICCSISIGACVTGSLCQVWFGIPAWGSVILMAILGSIGIITSL